MDKPKIYKRHGEIYVKNCSDTHQVLKICKEKQISDPKYFVTNVGYKFLTSGVFDKNSNLTFKIAEDKITRSSDYVRELQGEELDLYLNDRESWKNKMKEHDHG